jgi:hypothetical protein
VKLAGY